MAAAASLATTHGVATASNSPQLALLQGAFPATPIQVLQRALERHAGSGNPMEQFTKAFNELSQWAPVELKQPLHDQEEREIFTWRVPLEQCQPFGQRTCLPDNCFV